MFASGSVRAHLLRGALGLGALVASVGWSHTHPYLLLLTLPLALIALRGCPMCWTLGLIETVTARLRGRASEGACLDGSCSVRRDAAAERHGDTP